MTVESREARHGVAALAGALLLMLHKGRLSGQDCREGATPLFVENILSNFNVSFVCSSPGLLTQVTGRLIQPGLEKPQPVNRTKVSRKRLTAEDLEVKRSEMTDLTAPRNLAAGLVPNSDLFLQHPDMFGDLSEGPGQELWT